MPMFSSVVDAETGLIRSAEWETHVRERRPVGICQDCGAELLGSPREIVYRKIYRETTCRNGHERVIPGNTFQGRVIPRRDVLFPEKFLHSVPGDD